VTAEEESIEEEFAEK
jgi:hypothetical protein